MLSPPIPMLLLAGRDRRPPHLPEAGREHRALRGYKGMLEIAGKPLIVRILERLRATGAFDPIFVAGPAAVYGELAGQVRLVDTDGDFGENIRAGLQAILAEFPVSLVAGMTSDVLPRLDELNDLLDDLERHQPLDFWVVECRASPDRDLGASAWKPKYLIRPEGEDAAVPTLPGHLVVVDPNAVRLDLLYSIFELAYRTRNHPAFYRRTIMVRKVLLTLVFKDVKRIFTLRRPNITWSLVWNGVVLIKKLVTSGVAQSEMEERLQAMSIRTSHRRRHPERRGRVAITDGLSLARDIDTEEEAREIASQVEEG